MVVQAFTVIEVIEAFLLDDEVAVEACVVVFVPIEPANFGFVAAPACHSSEGIANGRVREVGD